MMDYILASASPRRHQLLRFILPDFRVCVSNAEERPDGNTPLEKLPELYARLKSAAVACSNRDSVVIGADTAVFSQGKMLGKPKDRAEAFSMLSSLSGRTHTVITGVCISYPEGTDVFSVRTDVTFRHLDADEINAYLDTGDYKDKAGSYGAQGEGAFLVERISGDFFNVMGLPVSELYVHLKKLDLLPGPNGGKHA